MAFYTSYFGNYRKFPENAYTYSIARFVGPRLTVNNTIMHFAPSESLFNTYKNGLISKEMYETYYRHQLLHIPPDDVAKTIGYMKANEQIQGNVVLLCYEKKTDFCHRHILRDFLNTFDRSLNITEL